MIIQILKAFIYTAIVNLLRKDLRKKSCTPYFLKRGREESRNKLSAEGKYKKNAEDAEDTR